MGATEAQAVYDLWRWLFRRAGPGGAAISDERFCEAALLLAGHSRGRLPTGLEPEQIALPLGHLVEGRRLELPPVDADVPIPGVHQPQRAA
jgi:hypothetical protein